MKAIVKFVGLVLLVAVVLVALNGTFGFREVAGAVLGLAFVIL